MIWPVHMNRSALITLCTGSGSRNVCRDSCADTSCGRQRCAQAADFTTNRAHILSRIAEMRSRAGANPAFSFPPQQAQQPPSGAWLRRAMRALAAPGPFANGAATRELLLVSPFPPPPAASALAALRAAAGVALNASSAPTLGSSAVDADPVAVPAPIWVAPVGSAQPGGGVRTDSAAGVVSWPQQQAADAQQAEKAGQAAALLVSARRAATFRVGACLKRSSASGGDASSSAPPLVAAAGGGVNVPNNSPLTIRVRFGSLILPFGFHPLLWFALRPCCLLARWNSNSVHVCHNSYFACRLFFPLTLLSTEPRITTHNR